MHCLHVHVYLERNTLEWAAPLIIASYLRAHLESNSRSWPSWTVRPAASSTFIHQFCLRAHTVVYMLHVVDASSGLNLSPLLAL